MFYYASSYNQTAFCSPQWVDSTADQDRMFEGVKQGSIAGSACCPAGTYWIGGSSECTDCDADFNGLPLYVQEISKGPWDAEKLCMGCMGRKLRKAVGTDLADIKARLAPLRTSQQDGIGAGC